MRNGTFARLALGLALAGGIAIASSSSAQAGGLADRARGYIGRSARELGLPRSLWCADFMNMLLHRRHAPRSARSYAQYGRPASPGCVGCIAVLRRGRRSGHVGVVAGWKNGDPIVISGNHGRIGVGESVYPHSRVIALREPEI